MKNKTYQLFATTPKGLELLLVDELRSLGATDPAEKLAGVTFTGDLELAYKACLWSRLANRILLRLSQAPAATPEELYNSVQTINWDEHINPTSTINVNFTTSQSKITHTLFGAQKVKDAIVDQMREKHNVRPNVARDNADVNINVYLYRDIATISIDLSGESLHKRGYRLEQGAAPLKENLAAAILIRAGWKNIFEKGGMLLDPMCGSGTFLIEAAMIASDIAPGLSRNYFGFLGWKKHDAKIWENLLTEAKERREKGASFQSKIIGYDINPQAVTIAFANIERAGFHGKIHVEKKDITQVTAKQSIGLLVVNPPYGERLGEMPELPRLYENLGAQLKKEFTNWQAAVFTGNPELGKTMGVRARKHYALFNGAIPCQLLLFDIQPEFFIDRSPEANNLRRVRSAQKSMTEQDLQAAQMVANRIRKNSKNLKRSIEREKLSCYRIYDADLPEYAVAIDFYNDHVCVQEYQPPKSIEKAKAEKRLQHVFSILSETLEFPAEKIFFLPPLHEGSDIAFAALNDFYQIKENNTQYFVNLREANCEVGLPLEQRNLRHHIQKIAQGKNFLNINSHSGAMTVCAALGGATTTKSICDNEFYSEWTKRNMELNNVTGRYVVTDIHEWIEKERLRYDLIFLELPNNTFYLRQEHPAFINKVGRLLSHTGELFLVTRDAKFRLEPDIFSHYHVEDIAQKMLPTDFVRRSNVYQCWKISKNNRAA